MEKRINVLLKMYDEHAVQARQHEDQRERMTSIILVISAALIAVISRGSFSDDMLPLSLILIFLGIYGWIFSGKHYERNRLHVSILKEFRDEIDKELESEKQENNQDSDKSNHKPKRTLEEIRVKGAKNHYAGFPKDANKDQKQADSHIARIRLSPLWSGVHLVVTLIGVVMAIIIIKCG